MFGFVGKVAVQDEAGVELVAMGYWDEKDEWVYVSRRAGRVNIWTGPACSRCTVDLLSVRRCEVHKDLVMVAVQCRLIV